MIHPFRTIARGTCRPKLLAKQICPVPSRTWQQYASTASKVPVFEDSENFWKVSKHDHDFWDAYVATRPNYSKSFYEIIYKHHAAHSTSYSVAHDVGCGAGQVAAELTTRFSHVVASDNNDHHLAVARRRLSSETKASKVSFTNAKAEDLASHHSGSSVDLVAAAEVTVLTDASDALRSFATLLKPGGTLATWFYGRPTFSEPEYFRKCQPILDDIMVLNWAKVIRGSGPARLKGFKRCADGMDNWLDFVRFPTDTWADVKRLKWNRHGTLPFFGEAACGFKMEPVSNVTEQETVVVKDDPHFWKNSWDVAALKDYFAVLFPGFKEAVGDGDAAIDALFARLTMAMGGEGAVRDFTWPCVLLLATRR